ncbi:MAG TPA: hypothetical protein VM265_03490 [Sphingomicrobium sp.]|nr:hypothetical protein [Sphingomicrobium sp.]
MDETLWTLVNIVGPLILLALLVWLVVRSRRARGTSSTETATTERTEAATHDLYRKEEQRRRDGTDGM